MGHDILIVVFGDSAKPKKLMTFNGKSNISLIVLKAVFLEDFSG